MATKQKKNPRWMDESLWNEPVIEPPKKKRSNKIEADEDFDIGV